MSDINLCDCPEHWMEIKNKKGQLYLLSSKGRIYSYKSGKFIGKKNKKGYISGINNFFSMLVHRLVYRYFNQINIEEVNENNNIDHINTIRNHNCLCNLNCCNQTENMNNPLTKKKISKSMKGKNHPFYGKYHSEESKKKISESLKGTIKSEESKQKLRKPRPKNIKCLKCNSKYYDIGNLTKYHKNCNKFFIKL